MRILRGLRPRCLCGRRRSGLRPETSSGRRARRSLDPGQLHADRAGRRLEHRAGVVGAPSLVRHADVEARLKAVRSAATDLFQVEEIGRSVEGRSINHLWFGRGPLHVLLWSQMHGDEPTATAACSMLPSSSVATGASRPTRASRRADHSHRADASPGRRRTLPAAQRQGSTSIATRSGCRHPEGRALKGLRDRLNPASASSPQPGLAHVRRQDRPAGRDLAAVGGRRRSAHEDPGPPADEAGLRAHPRGPRTLAPGRIARYDDEFRGESVRDNLTKWGTSVILIETGPCRRRSPIPISSA